jgi:membrane protein implicated in regulation of membrane protease activity
MHLWQILSICGIAFLILEMFTPSLFFLNFSLSAFICAILSCYTKNIYTLSIAFFVFSFVSFIFLRPIIMKRFNKSKETGINGKYIDKIAKAETEITSTSGVITIYGERWDARSENSTVIPQGSEVKIVRNDSIIMYVTELTK